MPRLTSATSCTPLPERLRRGKLVRTSDYSTGVVMETEERWRWLAQGRRDLADLLETLTPRQWETPSLCAGWRVRDVAAHVAMTPTEPTLGGIVTGLVRARGRLWDFGRDVAIEYADARPPEEIVEVL